jgi:hypothetical protein
MGIRAASFDNIPDCLFKSGKPDSTNSNRANSQRCTILNLGGPDPATRLSSSLRSWLAHERAAVLSNPPIFFNFLDNDPTGQIPRPASQELIDYLAEGSDAQPLGSFLQKTGRPSFAVGSVARNYIGIREYMANASGCIPIRVTSEETFFLTLHILTSRLFYDYWRTYGDGFHVTVDLLERFPVTRALSIQCRARHKITKHAWMQRASYMKEKLNRGKVVRSFDFRSLHAGGRIMADTL